MLQPDLKAATSPNPWRFRSGNHAWHIVLRWLDTERAPQVLFLLVPILLGFYSLWLGADANWDLTNYHLYNPFALIEGKLAIDLAPAGMQTYFNPLIDLPFYELNRLLAAPLAGFIMGALQGLILLPVFRVARLTVPAAFGARRQRIALLIALAGCLTGAFLSELGNSMGDNVTALLVLCGLAVMLSRWDDFARNDIKSALAMTFAGLLTGLACGLKLTNGVYALALFGALTMYHGSATVKFRLCMLFGIGVVLGVAITGGYWMLHLWNAYGNPLYPQFSALFPSGLTRPISSADTRWGPRGLLEVILWPFIFSASPHRVGETEIHQIIWPLVYLLFWGLIAKMLRVRLSGGAAPSLAPRQVLVVLFVALGYILWLWLFAIYRYLVAIEVLAPLVALIVFYALLAERRARILAAVTLALSSGLVLAGGAHTWGHEGWADPIYHADLPGLDAPAKATVLLFSPINAWAWLATMFPADVAFIQLQSSFPEGAAFVARVQEITRARAGPAFAVIDGFYDKRAASIASTNALLVRFGVTRSVRGCAVLAWAESHFRLHARLVAGVDQGHCEVAPIPSEVRDIDAENRAIALRAVPVFRRYGFELDPLECQRFRAGIGKGIVIYQWCPISPVGAKL